MGLTDCEANRDLLEYLRARARPGTGRGAYDLDGWEMHTHPDLIERLGDIAGSPQAVVPVYGVAAVAQKQVAIAVALDMGTLLFRLPTVPTGVEAVERIEPLCSRGWHAVCAWQSQLPSAEGLRRLTELLRKARQYANQLDSPRLA